MKLLFDLDGTLIDSNSVWQEIDRVFLAKRGFALTEEYNQGVIHATFPVAAQFTKAFCGLAETEEEIMAEWQEAAYQAYAQDIPLKAGVSAFLAQCAQAGYEMSIYTSCEEALCLAALEHHKIRHYFSEIFFVRNLKIEKRAPEGFLWVAQQLQTPPEQILFFDDSPLACLGAKEAGLQVVGCYDPLFSDSRSALEDCCDHYLTSFEEVAATPDFLHAFAANAI